MIQCSFYDAVTGVLTGTKFSTTDDAAVAANTPAGHKAITGHFDPTWQVVDVTQNPPGVIAYQPASPGSDYEWNDTAHRWQLLQAVQAKLDAHNAAMSQIAQLEYSQSRAVREAVLGMSGALARLQAIDTQIIALRLNL